MINKTRNSLFIGNERFRINPKQDPVFLPDPVEVIIPYFLLKNMNYFLIFIVFLMPALLLSSFLYAFSFFAGTLKTAFL